MCRRRRRWPTIDLQTAQPFIKIVLTVCWFRVRYHLWNLWMNYALSASTVLKRDARIDGNNDPTNPITPPNINAKIIKSNVTRKLNAISLNVTQFDVPVETKFNGNANKIPIAAPISAIATDSKRNAVRMLNRLNPSTRSVPLSLVRRATAAYIVFMPAKPAPTAMMKEMNTANPFNAPEAAPC